MITVSFGPVSIEVPEDRLWVGVGLAVLFIVGTIVRAVLQKARPEQPVRAEIVLRQVRPHRRSVRRARMIRARQRRTQVRRRPPVRR
ncbi:hypothetical protein ACFVH7_26345 [Kitasatospora indigofera]|uniref:hypothetical protein n=1 Tax=Kitasatospora indigofera TaxID=67307 RepID=UPI00363BFF73